MVSWLADLLNVSTGTARVIITAAIVVGLWLLRYVVLRLIRSRIDDPAVWYRARKVASYVIWSFGLIVIVFLWLEGTNVTTYLGLLSAGLAIALADILKDIAGWLFIVLRRPFRIGDRIEVNGHIGDIVDLRVFRFSMLEVGNWVDADQSTGRLIHIPNLVVFTSPISNYTEGFAYIWHEVAVLITFESNWERAEQLIQAALDEHAPHHDPARAGAELRSTMAAYQIRYGHTTPTTYLTVRDSGVLITGRLLIQVRRRRQVEQAVWKSILRAFAQADDIDLAYPTVRTWLPDELRVRS